MKKYKIWLMRLVPIICILTLTIGLSEMFYRSMLDSTREKCWNELSASCDETANNIETRFSTNLKILDLTADSIMLNTDFGDEGTLIDYLGEAKKETMFDRFDIVLPSGTILIQSTGEQVEDVGEKTFEELLALGTHLSIRVEDFLTGEESVHAFSPVFDANGDPVAILAATVYCSTLGDVIGCTHYDKNANIFVVDRRDGSILTDKNNVAPGNVKDMSQYDEKSEGFVEDILNGGNGRFSYDSRTSNESSYTVYRAVENTDFSIVMMVQDHIVLAELAEMKSILAWVGVAECTLLVLLGIWVCFIILRSMQNESRAQKAEFELLQKKELELESQYADASNRQEFLEMMAINLPGGYHRCTTDHSFKLTFVSNSFVQVTGYTLDQLNEEYDGSYMALVLPEDRDYFMSLAPQLESEGYIQCSYRLLRRDGSVRWVMDVTQHVERHGEEYYQCALMDITEQIEEIENAKFAAEASSRAKSTFLFNISHDIRTPMNAINGFSHIVEENADDPALVRSTVAKIKQASESLMLLINDVLDISRIERGKEELNLQATDLFEHGKNLYEMFSSDMDAAGIDFVRVGEELHEFVYCDRLKLTRIMMNMLSNAKKFTPSGGTVTCGREKLSEDDGSCTYRFFVRDTGIGMSPEFRKRAFEQFERERTSTESGVSGSGLGLAIIKMLVDLMGGTVDIQSELGVGTEISATITFKLADNNGDSDAEYTEQSAADLSGKRVLLVEDNAFNREIAKYVLLGMGLEVEEAENGAICIERIMEAPAGYFDLILMDIQMPVMDGYTATIEIRNLADKAKAGIPIVAMTANAFDEDKRRCIDAGMNGHIGKPIDIKDLTRTLSEIDYNTER